MQDNATTGVSESFEGRFLAHRKVLALLLAELSASARLREYLEQRSMFQGHEEDPGVLPSAEFAFEAAVAEELRLIAEESDRMSSGSAG